jgi:excisionase family DNA binding protein
VDPLYTPDDLSEILGVPRSTIGYWRREGRGPRPIQVGEGTHFRYRREDLEAWLKQEAEKYWPKDIPAPRRYRRKEESRQEEQEQ